MEDIPRPLTQHLDELRRRLILCVGVFFAVFMVCYFFSDYLVQRLIHPFMDMLNARGLPGRRLIFTGVSEAFTAHLKISAFVAFIFSFPFMAMQAWLFMAPGLLKRERALFYTLMWLTPVLFLCGGIFAYQLVLPLALDFFLHFESKNTLVPLVMELRISEYLSFVIRLIMAFGLCFELPIALYLLVKAGFLSAVTLAKQWRLVIVSIFALSAIITPPDMVSMLSLAVPLCLLYGGCVLWLNRGHA